MKVNTCPRKLTGAIFAFAAFLLFVPVINAQSDAIFYEVEMMQSKGKGKRDSRQVNAKIYFEKEKVVIKSRRKSMVFAEFAYSEISKVFHTYE